MTEQITWAVKNGDVEALKTKKFDPNGDYGQQTLLVSASDYGQCEVISYLISLGADVNKCGANNICPLLVAIYEDHVKAAKILIENGADKNGVGLNGEKYMELATSDEMKKLLS